MNITNDKTGLHIHTSYAEVIFFILTHIFYLLLTGGILLLDLIILFTPLGVDILKLFLMFMGLLFVLLSSIYMIRRKR